MWVRNTESENRIPVRRYVKILTSVYQHTSKPIPNELFPEYQRTSKTVSRWNLCPDKRITKPVCDCENDEQIQDGGHEMMADDKDVSGYWYAKETEG